MLFSFGGVVLFTDIPINHCQRFFCKDHHDCVIEVQVRFVVRLCHVEENLMSSIGLREASTSLLLRQI